MKFRNFILLILALALFLTMSPAQSEDNDTLEETRAYHNEMAQRFMPYFKNLQTCTPYNGDEIVKIHGKKNKQCHFRYIRYECKTPETISWQYGKAGYDLFKMLQSDKQNIDIIRKNSKYLREMEKNIINDYCKHITKD